MPVYFIQAGDAGPIKIGYSAEPRARLRDLQQKHYEELKLIAAREGCTGVEKAMHKALAQHHIRHEWYRPHADVFRMAFDLLAPLGLEISRHAFTELWKNHPADAAISGRPLHPLGHCSDRYVTFRAGRKP